MSREGRPLASVFLRDSRTQACSFCDFKASENPEAIRARDKTAPHRRYYFVSQVYHIRWTSAGTNASLIAKIILADYNMSN